MRTLIVALLIFATSAPLAAPAASTPDTSIQAAMDARTAAMPGSGIILGVLDHGALTVYKSGATGTQRPLDEHTVFEIGSVTKTFTATILARMVMAGKVKLSDPVSKYLPSTVHVPSKGGLDITLLNLATQHSGLPRLPDNFNPKDPDDPYADYTTANLYAFLNAYKLPRDPGAKYEYSNLGVGLLGLALANHSNTTYSNLLSSQILKPLGMNETAIALSPSERAQFAVGHDADGTVVKPWNLNALVAAGGIRSSLSDMLDYLKCNLGEGPLASACLFAQRPRDTLPGHKIGLVWNTSDKTGAIDHGGDTAGFHAYVIVSADHTVGAVALSSGPEVGDIATHAVVSSWPIVTDTQSSLKLTTAQFDEYAGKYRNDAQSFSYTIYRTGDKLYAQIAGQGPAVIYASRPDHFYYKIVDAYVEFVRQDGKIVGLILTQDGQTISVPRLDAAGKPMAATLTPAYPPVVQLDAQTMAGYVGTYKTETSAFVATVKDGHLFMQLGNQPSFEIYASAKDEFYYKVVDAQITFHRDASGAITGLTLHQSGSDRNATKSP
jgi:D-alanyl-D-alanine-carboxypeptidase/D-alanyl-D-alanine-endopeptidase